MGPLAESSPVWAQRLTAALTGHLTRETRSSYRTAVRQFAQFCRVRGNASPFPVDRYWFSAWIMYLSRFISVDSMSMYCAGVRDQHELLGHVYEWMYEGDPVIRKVMRYVKKTFGCSGSRVYKLPITLYIILRIAKHMTGWPVLGHMSHEDRLWLTASVIAEKIGKLIELADHCCE